MSDAMMHILVGTDFSEASSMAMSHAVKLARKTGARLHVLHVATHEKLAAPVNLGLNIPDQFPEAKEARLKLQRMMAELGGGLDVEIHVWMGEAVSTMLQLIKELKPDLVVVCSHGKGLVKRALLGSVSNQLVRKSPVPVLVVPTPGREAILEQPEPTPEPQLPSVGRAVIDGGGSSDGFGIDGVGGGGVNYR